MVLSVSGYKLYVLRTLVLRLLCLFREKGGPTHAYYYDQPRKPHRVSRWSPQHHLVLRQPYGDRQLPWARDRRVSLSDDLCAVSLVFALDVFLVVMEMIRCLCIGVENPIL